MNKIISTVVMIITMMIATSLQAQTSPDYIFGSDNGSGWNWTTGTQGTANLGSTYSWQFLSTATTNHYFKFGETSSNADNSGFWTNSGGDLLYNGAGTMWNSYYFNNMNGGGAIYFAVTTGNYYVIKTRKDPGNNNCNFAIFDNGTTAPVTITSVQGSISGSDYLIDVQLSGAKGTNEKVWVRYTTDGTWTTSTTIEAGLDQTGNKWRATIAKESKIYEYYVYTTIQQAVAPAENLADFYTINYANNSGLNYKANLVTKLNYKLSTTIGTFTYLADANAFTWATGATADEGYTTATNIGFNFNYCGAQFTQFQVSTNGFLKFGTGLANARSIDSLSGKLTRSVLAPLWDNLSVSATATDITYKLDGTAPNRILTVEWKNVKWNNTAIANAEFQIKLYEYHGKIEYAYGTMGTPTAGSASIGMNDNSSLTYVTNPSTGTFISINVGGSVGSRVYHQTMGHLFNAINNAPTSNTVFTFTPIDVTPITAGTYTIGGIGPTYASLSDAAMNLNMRGISGAVLLNVREGTYDDIFHLIDVAGTSAANTITLTNESGTVTFTPNNGSAISTAGAATSDGIIRLDGTQYTKIQNLYLSDNGLASVALKFEMGIILGNSITTSGAMRSGGRFNTFKNLNIDMKCTTGINHAGSIGIRYFTTSSVETDTAKATSYNLIDGCTITGFWRAGWKNFGIKGANPDRGNVMRNCTLGDVAIGTGVGSDIRALEMDVQNGLLIENNTIKNISNSINTTNSIYGIWCNPASSTTNFMSGTNIIRNNIIYNLENTGTTTTSGFAVGIACNNVANNTEYQVYNNKIYDIFSNGTYAITNPGPPIVTAPARAIGLGMYMSTGTGAIVKIYNNMISDIRVPRSTGAPSARGIDVQNAAGTATFSIYNNTVYLNNDVAPTEPAHYSTCIYWANMGTGSIDLRNNIFVNTMNSTTGKSVCLMPSANSNYVRLASTSNNNIYYYSALGTTNGISYDFTTLRTTLAAHQTVVAGSELNSILTDITPAFETIVAPYDLHIKAANWIPSGQGQPTAIVTNDIDGNSRSVLQTTGPVDIGADEYTATGSASAVETGIIEDLGVTTYTGVDGKIIAQITWHSGTGTLPTSITFTYTPGVQATGTTNPSIYRNFTITAADGTPGWSADIVLFYNAATELNGFTETAMRINKKDGLVWTVLPTVINTTTHSGSATVTSFSNFSFDDGSHALPVELTSFTASSTGDLVKLNWSTATEINSYLFEIQRSSDNNNWFTVGDIQANGNSNSVKNYEYTDVSVSGGKYYYRLKQIDNDGAFEFSEVVEVEVGIPTTYSISQNYPNPFNPSTKINYSIPTSGKVSICIYSITGELVQTLVNEQVEAGNYSVEFNGSNLASGTYFYRISANDFVQTKKMLLIK